MVVKLVTNGDPKSSKSSPVREAFKVLKKHSLKISGPNKENLLLKPDGCLYKMFESFGSLVSSPLLRQEVYEMLTDDTGGKVPKSENYLKYLPSEAFKVPIEYVRGWGQQLLEYDSEALCVYGVDRQDKKKWLGVVPKQKVTGGSVDVDAFGKAISVLSSKGYRVVGTLHTHPGGMTGCSAIDTGQLWNKFSGLHLIVTHTGILSYHFSTRGSTWSLSKCEGFDNIGLWKKNKIPKPVEKTSLLLGEDGSEVYRPFIVKKTYGIGFGTRNSKRTKKARNTKYYDTGFEEDLSNPYWGDWDARKFTYVFEKQANGQRVTPGYVMELGGYWDKDLKNYYAGRPIGYGQMTKNMKDRFIITDPKASDLILPPKIEKKKSSKEAQNCKGLIEIVDWMETQEGVSYDDLSYNLHLDDCIKDLGFASEALEQFLMESISQELHPSKNMKTSIIKALIILPKLEQILWGAEGRTLKTFIQMLPPEWKGIGK